jgi:hypothetical protein
MTPDIFNTNDETITIYVAGSDGMESIMKFCGKCGEPINSLEQLSCNNCFSPILPNRNQQASATEQPSVNQQAPTTEQPPINQQAFNTEQPVVNQQASTTEQQPVNQQAPVQSPTLNNQPSHDANEFFNQTNNIGLCPTETEDISRAFYTTETGDILPLYHQGHQEDVKPKKKFLLPLLIGVGVIVAIAFTVGLIASGIFTSPVDRFIAIQRNHVIDPLLSIYDDFEEEDISFDLFVTASGEVSRVNPVNIMALSIIEQIVLELNINTGIDPVEGVFGLTFSAAGADLLSAVITADDEYFGFSIPTINDTYYIINHDAFDELLGGGEGFLFNAPEMTPEEMASFIERYSDILLSIVNENNLEVNRETVSLFDGREVLNAQVYTVTPSEDDLYDFLLAMLEEIREDEFIYQAFAGSVAPQMPYLTDYQTTWQYWNSLLDELEYVLDETAEALYDSGFSWRVATHRRQLILQEVAFGVDEVTVLIQYEGFLSGNRRTDWFNLEIGTGNNSDYFISLRNDMTVSRTEADGSTEFEMTTRTGSDENLNTSAYVSYNLDLTTFSILEIPYGTYELELSIVERFTNISAEASLVVEAGADGGSDHLITIYNLDDLGMSHLTIYVHSTDEPSDIQAPTGIPVDLSDMSEMELFLTLMEIANALESVFDFFNQF